MAASFGARAAGMAVLPWLAFLRLGKIVHLKEGDPPLVDGGECLIVGSCGLTLILNGAKTAFYKSLDQNTLLHALDLTPHALPILRSAKKTARWDDDDTAMTTRRLRRRRSVDIANSAF